MHWTVVVALVMALLMTAAIGEPDFPVLSVAILTSPIVDCPGPQPSDYEQVHSCIRGTYVQWLHAVGVRVVALKWDDTVDNKRQLLNQVNGVIFAGGGMDSHPGEYETFWEATCDIVNMVKKMNSLGDHIALLGICQGFQMIAACAAHDLKVVEDGYQGMYPLMMSLNFTTATASSKFLGSAPASIRDDLQTFPTTLNYHHEGVAPTAFATGTPLDEEFIVTSTNADVNGRSFVSTYEARNMSIFGVQWHPEWPPFDFSLEQIGKSVAAMEVSHWVAMYFRSLLSQNNHSFASPQDLEALVVDTMPCTYQGYGVLRYWVGGRLKAARGDVSTLAVALSVIFVVLALLAGVVIGRQITMKKLGVEPLPDRPIE